MEQKANETKVCELTNLLARALKRIEHHEESDYPKQLPKQSDCDAPLPLATKVAKVHEPCSRLVKQTGLIYSQNYDIMPMQRESLVDWWTKVLLQI